jgi:hypothetical protein
MNMNPKSCLLFAALTLTLVGPAAAANPRLIPAKPSDALESSATLYSGLFKASDGYSDRWVVGSYANVYRGDFGLHSDVVYVNREVNAFFGAFGLSHALGQSTRGRIMVGSSTSNRNILPNAYLSGSLEIKPSAGLVVTPSLTYRHYRSGGRELAPAVQLARYFDMPSDSGGYYVLQADGGLSFNDSGRAGWTAGAGLTTVRKSGLSFGIAGRTGYSAYDSAYGYGVTSRNYGGSVTAGYRIGPGYELFVRGDATRSRHYTVAGALVGVKIPLR